MNWGSYIIVIVAVRFCLRHGVYIKTETKSVKLKLHYHTAAIRHIQPGQRTSYVVDVPTMGPHRANHSHRAIIYRYRI